ncbi:Isochorismatase-like protein [Fusarium flagelliforme]|uniref:Protein ycac n=1 Tax=Fusarium flagelliforme TaxID=2675880 RepID=A0A395MMC2_9HYPO|nr:Isochorismatase-like protein [Fusarium flagelliforme]KAH7174026.1 Isochorismatase-like protein [Fusarium flagelliforme]RFN48927.1 protein ycac [Fusarium flagelliforme]
MKFTSIFTAGLLSASALAKQAPYKYERLDKDDALLLVVDIQEGLYQYTRDWDPTLYHHQSLAHAAIGKAFDLPVILTTSADQGPNGPLTREIRTMYPKAPLIQRQGQVNAWDSEEFRDAVKATNKSQIILAGIVTDVCTTFLALSLREAGYSVWANIEASGTTSALIRDVSNDRMRDAGVQVVSLFAIICELMRDWRNTPGSVEIYPWLGQYMPLAGYVARGHAAAISNGTIQPGEESLTTYP